MIQSIHRLLAAAAFCMLSSVVLAQPGATMLPMGGQGDSCVNPIPATCGTPEINPAAQGS